METGEERGSKGSYFRQVWLPASRVELRCLERAIRKSSSFKVEWGQGKGLLSPKQRLLISSRLVRCFCSSSSAPFLLCSLSLIMSINQVWSACSSPVPVFPPCSHGRSYWLTTAPFSLSWYRVSDHLSTCAPETCDQQQKPVSRMELSHPE